MNDNFEIEIIDDVENELGIAQNKNTDNKEEIGYHENKNEGKFIMWFLFIFLLLFIIFLPWISSFLSKFI